MLDMRVDHAGNFGDFLLKQAGDPLVVLGIAALDLHIDLGRHAEIQNLRHDIGGLEIEKHVGKG